MGPPGLGVCSLLGTWPRAVAEAICASRSTSHFSRGQRKQSLLRAEPWSNLSLDGLGAWLTLGQCKRDPDGEDEVGLCFLRVLVHPESGDGFSWQVTGGPWSDPATQGVIHPGSRHGRHLFTLTSSLSSMLVGWVSGKSAYKGPVCGLF